MWSLRLRMWLLLAVLFAIIYAVIAVVGAVFFNISDFSFYLIAALVMMFIQYMMGPKIIEWSMRVRYIEKKDNPELFRMMEDLSRRAKLPMPRIGIAEIPIPNAFAFGRSIRDGRICVTEGILRLLDAEELRAVLGHELSHLKNRDVLTITLLSVIPVILYRIALSAIFSGRRRDSQGGSIALLGIVALIFYFITNLLVLYASRIREYFADRGSIALGNRPSALASSLYKLVYGSARMDEDSRREVEGLKAFFVNDPSQSLHEISELRQLDLDKSGTLDDSELLRLKSKRVHLNFGDKMMELLSTHPNMLKRIKQLSDYRG